MAVTDRLLALRAKRGDVDAFEQLVQKYQDLAFHAAYLITGDAQDAEDATQEAFLSAFYGLSRFRAGASFKPWLLRIVTNKAKDRKRSQGRYSYLKLRATEGTPGPGLSPSPESIVLWAEQQEEVIRALSVLSDDDRIVLSYRYLLDLSTTEIAAVLSCPPSTARSRLSRALRRLQHQLQDSQNAGQPNPDEAALKEVPNG